MIVSVSPAGNIENNYNSLYADVKKWVSEPGYCDWLIPQLYYGFESSKLPFDKAAEAWQKIHNEKSIKLIAGIPAYKASDDPQGEWKSGNITARQIQYIRDAGYDGYALFSYSSLFKETFSENLESMQALPDPGAES